MLGRRFNVVCAADAETELLSIRDAMQPNSPLSGGAVVEFDGRRKNGEVFPIEACISAWEGTDGIQYGAILRDISVRKREAEKIRYLAEHDPLTGLANRHTLQSGLTAMVATAERRGDQIALMVLGLDGFQNVNDMLGQACGDLLLCAVSGRLRAETAGLGIVARLGGDEFAIAIRRSSIKETIGQLADHIAFAFKTPFITGTRQHRIGVSIGVAIYPDGGQTADELLANGHLAYARAKTTRRGSYRVFENSIRHELEKRLTLESELALAAERNEFELFYQPQVDRRLLDRGGSAHTLAPPHARPNLAC